MPLQRLYDERIRRPCGIDFFLGLPEDQEPRYREVLYDADPVPPWLDPLSLDGLNSNAPVSTIMELPNHRIVRAAGMSSAGGVGLGRRTGPALRRRHDRGGRGPRVPEPGHHRPMAAEQVWGLDRCLRAGQRLCRRVHETPSPGGTSAATSPSATRAPTRPSASPTPATASDSGTCRAAAKKAGPRPGPPVLRGARRAATPRPDRATQAPAAPHRVRPFVAAIPRHLG